MLKEKLKLLRARLRWWNKFMFEQIELKVKEDVLELNRIDNIAAQSDSTSRVEGSKEREKVVNKVWECIHYKESIISQKSRNR